MNLITITNKNEIGKLQEIKDLNDIDTDTKEGRLVMAMLAKITTEYQTDKTPGEVLSANSKLVREMFKKGSDE